MVKFDRDLCIHCGKCAWDCTDSAITTENGVPVFPEDCCLCGHCVAICPAGAVSIPEYDMADVEEFSSFETSFKAEDLLHVIKSRRSIRHYLPKKIEQEKLEKIIQAGRYTATACNEQGSHFIVVQNEFPAFRKLIWDYLDELYDDPSTPFPATIASVADLVAMRRQDPERDLLLTDAPCFLVIASNRPWDTGMAAQAMELMALAQGVGALYLGFMVRVLNSDRKLLDWLGVPEHLEARACMALGYSDVEYLRTAPRREAWVRWK